MELEDDHLYSGLLDDTPAHRQRVDELEASAKRLKDRCSALLTGAKKYRDGITTMLDAQLAFAAALTEFGGGTDEESLHLGSAVMSQFIKVFRELAGFYDFLRTQLDLGLIERLQKDWLEGTLASQRDEKRKYDRRAAEYDSARVKHQSLKKLTKKEVLERSHADLATARRAEEEGRFDLARKLTEVELAKRYGFLELVVGSVHAHLMFFRNGTELLSRLEGPINDALQIAEHLRRQEGKRKVELESMIQVRREAADRREALIAKEVAALDAAAADGSGAGGAGTGGPTGGGLVLSHAPGGPIQLSAANTELLADIERLISATRASSGQQVTIIKQGYLSKRSQGKGRADFKRRFFVLDSNGMMYYYSHKADSIMAFSRSVKPKNTLPLLTSTVKLDAEDPAVRCAFRVVSPEGTYTLQAESDYERGEWIVALQGVINCLLNGAVEMSSLPRVPVRPTHSRTGSHAEAALAPGHGPIDSSSGAAGPGGTAGAGGGGGGWGLPGRRASHASVGGGGTPPGSQPGTPSAAAAALASIPSGDGSGSEAGEQRPAGAGPRGSPDPAQRAHSRLAPSTSQPGGGRDAAAESAGGAGPHSGGSTTNSSSSSAALLERLRQVPGNRRCVDCGAQDPDWASLNLGVLLCIECSGVHRQLGVHLSRVRSCTLDVKVWEPPVVGVFEAIGNDYANEVWEANPPPTAAEAAAAAAASSGDSAPAAAGGNDAWVLCGAAGEDGGGEASSPDRKQRQQQQQQQSEQATTGDGCSPLAGGRAGDGAAAAALPPLPPRVVCKPSPSTPLSAKAAFIRQKYAARAFAGSLPQAQARLWDAVAARDVRGALAALAAGADINAAYRTPRAQRLVSEACTRAEAIEARAGTSGSSKDAAGPGDAEDGAAAGTTGGGGACGGLTVLHLAGAIGDAVSLEFLLQNGAAWQHTDAHGRTPLHYAVLFDAAECGKLLMRRSGAAGELRGARDARGQTAMDLAMKKGRVADEELFVLLTE